VARSPGDGATIAAMAALGARPERIRAGMAVNRQPSYEVGRIRRDPFAAADRAVAGFSSRRPRRSFSLRPRRLIRVAWRGSDLRPSSAHARHPAEEPLSSATGRLLRGEPDYGAACRDRALRISLAQCRT